MIYFIKDNLMIRSMIKSDIERFVRSFAKQGWNKTQEQFENYYTQQENKEKKVVVAEYNGNLAGYVTMLPCALTGPFANKKIPEIVDFNVLIEFQKRGIGNRIMDIVESLAKEDSNYVSLSVGLHSGYGTAQRMYVKRGYIPDGTGVWYYGKPLEPYSSCKNDDELTIYLLKLLAD